MAQSEIKVYGYRWVILGVYFLINVLMQIQWITFAPITSEAVTFYNVSPLQIDLLSLIFMIVYLFVSFPASYIIDTWGIRIGIGIGALLMGIFGLMKGFYGSSYKMIIIAQIGIAIGQPFVLNAVTKVGVRWFPLQERATQAGISVLAQFVGIIIAMVATPFLFKAWGMEKMLMLYGTAALTGAVIFILFNKEHPPTPPCPAGHDERISVFAGLKHILKQRDMLYMIIVFFISIGIFNAVTTWIEQIVRPRGFSITEAGICGAIMMVGGIIGAATLPPLSDKWRKRKIFIVITLIGSIPGILGLTFANSYWLLLASCFISGFFLMAAAPIGFQYSAEISYPAPEATSQGLLLLAGQISGIIFIFGMDIMTAAGAPKTPAMLIFMVMMILNVFIVLRLHESKMIKTDEI
ncbi:MAG: MFS transporter [Smithella sp.]|nr:MFS transporter [Smithella sp.]MDM7988736.1 MFS transporter [Smithella sp.]HQG66295.1 MFS transporter [Smithella sp.]HQH15707.1 MFS transporter [Smithella sp.]HQI73390.1 MFS transporter [Smithella sp.]